MDTQREPIFTRPFVLLLLGNFIVVSIYFLLMTTMAYYAVTSYGADSAIAGLTASIFLVGGVAGRILCGRYGERLGLRRLALLSLSVQLAMCMLYFANGLGLGFLIGVRLVHGLSFGVANTVLPALAIDRLPSARLGEGTGYFMLSNSLGVGIGPLMSILLVIGVDYSVLFAICVGLSVVALVLCALVRSRPYAVIEESPYDASASVAAPAPACEPCAQPEPQPKGAHGFIRSIIDFSTFRFSVFMFLVAFSYSSLNAFVNSYAIELNMGFFAPFVFLVYSAALLVTRPITGKLMDRYGENAVLYPSIASMGVGLLLAAFAQNPVMLLACGVFMATGFGTCMSVGQAAAIKLSTCGHTPLTISTFFLLCDGGCGVGPFVLGFAVSGGGYQAMYVICAFIAFAAVGYYHLVHGRKHARS